MTPQVIIAIISAITAVVVAVVGKTEIFSRKHSGIKKDIELFASLPDKSKSKERLLNHIDRGINQYITKSTQHKRNGTEISIGVIFLPAGIYLWSIFYSLGSWWYLGLILPIIMIIIGAYGLISGLRKVERDDKGNAVSNKKST